MGNVMNPWDGVRNNDNNDASHGLFKEDRAF